jgi:NTE family protein
MQIGLALSGGGMRAAVFHLGVLRRLAAEGLLEEVSRISTVSGGSLVTGLVFAAAHGKWPTSSGYLSEVYPAARRLITASDLFGLRVVRWRDLSCRGANPIRTRAPLLAESLARLWGVSGLLRDLPERPLWWINATCLETGKNWRFSRREMGDWEFGRHYDPPYRTADAAAASAAVPYVIGALPLKLPADGWYRTDPATRSPVARIDPPVDVVRLWDGGAYENLALEAIFKIDRPLEGCDFLVCSDASGPLNARSASVVASMLRGRLASPRLFSIASDQIRSLRSRMLVNALSHGRVEGVLLRMGNSVRDIDIKSGRTRPGGDYDLFQRDREASLGLAYPTDLRALPEADFDRIARHGFEIADATLSAYAPTRFPRSFRWPI